MCLLLSYSYCYGTSIITVCLNDGAPASLHLRTAYFCSLSLRTTLGFILTRRTVYFIDKINGGCRCLVRNTVCGMFRYTHPRKR